MNHLSLTFRISRSAAQWRTNIVRASENWTRSSVKEVDGVDDSHNYVSDMQVEEDGYSSDDCFTFAHGRRMSREHQKEYLRHIKESEVSSCCCIGFSSFILISPLFAIRGLISLWIWNWVKLWEVQLFHYGVTITNRHVLSCPAWPWTNSIRRM